jgi:hypothetical protein
MFKRLKIAVPAVQVLAIACVLILDRVTTNEKVLEYYLLPVRELVMNLNFPLVALSRILVLVDDLSANLHISFAPSGILLMAVLALAGLALLSCVVLFWYLVVVEIEGRQSGESLIRFSNKSAELVKTVALLLLGFGSLFYAYTDTVWPIDRQLSHHGLWPIEIVIGGLVLIAWGVALIAMASADFRRLLTSRNVSELPL